MPFPVVSMLNKEVGIKELFSKRFWLDRIATINNENIFTFLTLFNWFLSHSVDHPRNQEVPRGQCELNLSQSSFPFSNGLRRLQNKSQIWNLKQLLKLWKSIRILWPSDSLRIASSDNVSFWL